MNDISIVALFCTDIREEKGGTRTIVGLFPDNVNVLQMPGALPQMCIYVRMHVRPDFEPRHIVTRVVMPDGTELDRNEMQPDLIEIARRNANNSGTPYAGLVATFVVAPMPVNAPGRMQVLVTVDDKEYVAGAINFQLAPPKAT